jgi:hypothetical protein
MIVENYKKRRLLKEENPKFEIVDHYLTLFLMLYGHKLLENLTR